MMQSWPGLGCLARPFPACLPPPPTLRPYPSVCRLLPPPSCPPGCPVPGPAGWTQYRTEAGEAYYHNSKTQETVCVSWPQAVDAACFAAAAVVVAGRCAITPPDCPGDASLQLVSAMFVCCSTHVCGSRSLLLLQSALFVRCLDGLSSRARQGCVVTCSGVEAVLPGCPPASHLQVGCAGGVEEPAPSQLSSDTAPSAAAARVRHSGSTECILMAPLMALRPGLTMTRPVDRGAAPKASRPA